MRLIPEAGDQLPLHFADRPFLLFESTVETVAETEVPHVYRCRVAIRNDMEDVPVRKVVTIYMPPRLAITSLFAAEDAQSTTDPQAR